MDHKDSHSLSPHLDVYSKQWASDKNNPGEEQGHGHEHFHNSVIYNIKIIMG